MQGLDAPKLLPPGITTRPRGMGGGGGGLLRAQDSPKPTGLWEGGEGRKCRGNHGEVGVSHRDRKRLAN